MSVFFFVNFTSYCGESGFSEAFKDAITLYGAYMSLLQVQYSYPPPPFSLSFAVVAVEVMAILLNMDSVSQKR